MKKTEYTLTVLAQITFEVDADPDAPKFDDELDSKRDVLVKKLEEMGFSVSVESEEFE